MATKARNKWKWLHERYPQLPIEPEYEDVLTLYRESFRDKTPEQLAAHINELEAIKHIQEDFVSNTNAAITAAERLLYDAMNTRGIEKMTVGGFAFAPKSEPVPKVGNRTEWLDYVLETQPEILTVHHKTMEGIVKRLLEANDDLPPGIEVDVRDTIDRRKG